MFKLVLGAVVVGGEFESDGRYNSFYIHNTKAFFSEMLVLYVMHKKITPIP